MPKNFKNDYRLEAVYFQKLKSDIDIAKSYIERGAVDEAKALLENAVDVDGAVLLLYRNIGELWAELADRIEQTRKALDALEKKMNEYHDELNEKIDEINNYIIRLINALEARVEALERESKVKFAYLTYDSTAQEYAIEIDGSPVDFDTLSALSEYPHYAVLIGSDGTIYIPRKISAAAIYWCADGIDVLGNYSETLVSIDDTDAVSLTITTEKVYTAGTGIDIDNNNVISADFTEVQAKLTAGSGVAIDNNNVISADFTEVQAKLTAGSGISIDANNEISNTAPGIAYTAGFGIDIDANNEISVDTADVQEKLIAGQNITLTPDATDPTKTVIDAAGGASYTAGSGISITNDVIKGEEVGIFETYSNPVSQSYQIAFSLETSGSSARWKYNSKITNAITGSNLKTLLANYDSVSVSGGSPTTTDATGENPMIISIRDIRIELKDTSNNTSYILKKQESMTNIYERPKGANMTAMKQGFYVKIDGIKKIFPWIVSSHSYQFMATIYAGIYSNGNLLTRTEYEAITSSSPVLAMPISIYGYTSP